MNRIRIAVYVFFVSILIFSSASYAEDSSTSPRIGIFVNGGFGYANNLRMADRLNVRRDAAEIFINGDEDEDKRKEPIGYAGIDLEPRLFSGNLVYGASIGYYNVSDGAREVNGTGGTFKTEITLEVVAFRGSVYYRVDLSDDSFLLLGGGLGYYVGTLEEKFSINNTEESDKDTKWTIGWHTALEYNTLFGPFLLSGGIMSRFADIYNFQVNEVDKDDKFSGGLTGLYIYIGAGYLL